MLTTCDTVCPRCRHVFPIQQTTLPSPMDSSTSLTVLSSSKSMSNFSHINPFISGVPSTIKQLTELPHIPVNTPQSCDSFSRPVSHLTLPTLSNNFTPSANFSCHLAPSSYPIFPSQLSSQTRLPSLPLGYQETQKTTYCYPTISSPTYGLDTPQFSLHPVNSSSTLPHLSFETLNPKINLSPPPLRFTKGSRTMRQLSGGCLVNRSKNEDAINIHEPRVTRQLSGGGLIDSADENFIHIDEPQVSPSLPLISLPLRLSSNENCEVLISDDSEMCENLSFEKRVDIVRNSITDRETLFRTLTALRTSGWFYEGVSWHDGETMLRSSPDGTFIVRESSNPGYLFALTVRTPRNPTSVRVQYIDGKFRLDCVSNLTPEMPRFECVVALIEHYVTNSARKFAALNNSGCYEDGICQRRNVLVDSEGTIYSPVYLRRPLLKKDTVPSLMHLTRLTINKSIGSCVTPKQDLPHKFKSLELPTCLKGYLLEYPYTI